MTEEIRYIANLQRQEEFDNEVTELKDELKRLEQENKELKAYKDVNEDFKKAWEELKQENHLLRSTLHSKNFVATMEENERLKQENELFRQAHKAEQDSRRKYENALEEIREIITNNNSMIIDRKVYLELQCGEPVALKLQKIYEKINEVLGNEMDR